ncbi:uncharacterized protein [Heterodontus francisci]|uniref:uncharacterized protein n=1 Tax=Heterodontus francisci TaxID=7792 RepID=UPI00355B190D
MPCPLINLPEQPILICKLRPWVPAGYWAVGKPRSLNHCPGWDQHRAGIEPGATCSEHFDYILRTGSSNGAAERWASTCPPISVTPSCDGDGWRAFHGDDGQTQESHFGAFPLSKWEMAQWGVGGKWWPNDALEHHTFEPTSPSESSLGKAGLESMFHSCFPTVSSAGSSDPIPPLGQLLGRSEEKWGEGFLSTQAYDLWGLLWNVDETVGLKYKWAECQSRRQLLASLSVDPASTDTSAGRTRTLGSSPLFSRETMEFQSFPVTLDQDYKELMLIKDSVPQLQTNGFSPTHRIQAFFYHWSQADRNGKTKTPYSFNKNFMA